MTVYFCTLCTFKYASMFFEISKSVSELERILDPTKENEHAYRGGDESSYYAIVERLDDLLENVRFGGNIWGKVRSNFAANLPREYTKETIEKAIPIGEAQKGFIQNTDMNVIMSALEKRTKDVDKIVFLRTINPLVDTYLIPESLQMLPESKTSDALETLKITQDKGTAHYLMEKAIDKYSGLLSYTTIQYQQDHPLQKLPT